MYRRSILRRYYLNEFLNSFAHILSIAFFFSVFNVEAKRFHVPSNVAGLYACQSMCASFFFIFFAVGGLHIGEPVATRLYKRSGPYAPAGAGEIWGRLSTPRAHLAFGTQSRAHLAFGTQSRAHIASGPTTHRLRLLGTRLLM